MIIIVTGGIGSGKSQVCRILAGRYGFHVYEADARVKELYDTHPSLLRNIETELGTVLRDNAGAFVPSRLSSVIFGNQEALNKVESFVFPALMDDFEAWISGLSDDRPVVFESATVLEKSYFSDFGDMTVLVNAPYELRLERAARRDGDRAKVEARMRHQSLMNRLSEGFADDRIDVMIDNSGSLEELEAEIEEFMMKLQPNTNVTYK